LMGIGDELSDAKYEQALLNESKDGIPPNL
jgi:hypothetical protein